MEEAYCDVDAQSNRYSLVLLPSFVPLETEEGFFCGKSVNNAWQLLHHLSLGKERLL
jgi:hypothetical protein